MWRTNWCLSWAVFFVVLSFFSGASGAVVYVKPDGNDLANGSSWDSAKQTVTAGLAATGSPGDQVWVAAGTYNERITLKTGVGLYGGFAGHEGNLSERNVAVHVTILDGQQGGSVVTAPSGADGATRIDGFTIRNGTGTFVLIYPVGSYTFGGGVFCDSSSPSIANNTISGNDCYGGAGIYCSNSSPSITNNTISENRAEQGGGLYCSNSSSPAITNNMIRGNRAGIREGGGIYCIGSSPSITNNVITGNGAFNASGGGICCRSSSPSIANNAIGGNSASSSGGGIHCSASSSPSIANNTISGNSASTGGGVCCSDSSPTIANNIIAFNSSGIYKYSGSGIPVLRNNCVYNPGRANYDGLAAGANDINLDPKLEAVAYGKVHLLTGSPCVDAGNDGDVQPGWTDMDSRDRKTGSSVDIGADEYDGTVYTFTPAVIRVSLSGDDAHDGSSWELAKRTVQAGIDTAAAVSGEVWVAAGVYNERITLKIFAHLYGGFAGVETQRNQRNFKLHAAILDGQRGGSVVGAFRCGYGTSRIDGFTIRNGQNSYGGGICCIDSSPFITNNTISGNVASPDNGGGVYCSGSSPFIANNTICGNSAPSGGGIYCMSSSPLVANNTICGNNSTSSGGGMYCAGSSPTVANNIIAFNSSGIYRYSAGGTPILRNNCVCNPSGSNYSGLSAGTGDISVNPLFADRLNDNFHLMSGSPCINTGNDTDVRPDWLDMDGQGRIAGAHVDIGADEYYAPGDATGDGVVGFGDFAALQNHYGQSGGWSEGDFGWDEVVTFEDFAILQNHYGENLGTAAEADTTDIYAGTPCLPAGIVVLGVMWILTANCINRRG